jgi:uncharacterized protein YyaL (SSP411 family)
MNDKRRSPFALDNYPIKPFDHEEGGGNYDRALMLTDACVQYTTDVDGDSNNAALALLVGGIAAVNDDDDRHALAAAILERIFARTHASEKALKNFLSAWSRKERIVGIGT